MPVEAKPLFRPDVLRPHLSMFDLPGHVEAALPKLEHWAALLRSSKADVFKEQELLPDFFTDFFPRFAWLYTAHGRWRKLHIVA